LAGAALAGAGTISNTIFRIDATNGEGSGHLEFYANELEYHAYNNKWEWSKGFTEIEDDITGEPIALLDQATLSITRDPTPSSPYRIDLGFALHAGLSSTLFSIKSALLTFSTPLPPGMLQGPAAGGKANASLGVTDENGNGAQLLADGPVGTGAYRARYNGWYPAGISFVTLVNLVQAGPGSSGGATQNYPGGLSYVSIDTTVADMSAGLGFTLTPGDSGSGTTSYRIMPEPAAFACLVVGVALFARRR
jgi:hypothetical protein